MCERWYLAQGASGEKESRGLTVRTHETSARQSSCKKSTMRSVSSAGRWGPAWSGTTESGMAGVAAGGCFGALRMLSDNMISYV